MTNKASHKHDLASFFVVFSAISCNLKQFQAATSKETKGGDTVKNMLKVLVIALTALAFSGAGFAADTAAPKTEMKAEKPKAMSATGAVTAVDAKAGTLSVKTKDKDLDLTAGSKAKSALGKVKVGDMVKVSYTE